MKRKAIKIVLLAVLVLCVLFLIFTELNILRYLKSYGYGTKELPQTTLVYFRLSKGFTVDYDDEYTVFIGRHSYIYDDVFETKGYYEALRMGTTDFYNETGKTEENRDIDFGITSTDDWCHWFRIYILSDGYKIEDF